MVNNNSTTGKKRRSSLASNTWHLATNHQNMLYMLAAGMVMTPAGFQGKYYSDPLQAFSDRIPLFRDTNRTKVYIPADALQQAISERKHLLPCIASFDLSGLAGPAFRLKRDGGFRTVESTSARKFPTDIAHVLPAPLPINLLRSITLRSSEDRQIFETAARDVANVDLPDSMVKVDESLFLTDSGITWPPLPRQTEFSETDTFLNRNNTQPQWGQAIGGLLAMLYHAANGSELGLAAFRLATGTADNNDHEALQRNPVLREFHAWLNGGGVGDQADDLARIYWSVVDALIHAPSHESQEIPIDTVLACLEGVQEKLQQQKFKDALGQLIADMRGCLGLGSETITGLFERHQSSLSKSLLLFCLREHSMDLLEFSHPMLGSAGYILACILFGVRDGWLRLPRELRDPALSDYVSYRMANHEHQKRKSQLTFTAPPPPPVPLRACFSISSQWSSKQQEMALMLADKCGWNDCIQTHITPRTGDILDDIECSASQIKVKGRVSVTEAVDSTLFLHRLGKWSSMPFHIQTAIRRAFESEEDTESQDDKGSCP